jgi:predicted transcriptional regulator
VKQRFQELAAPGLLLYQNEGDCLMQTVKEKIAEVVLAQPEDATYEEIVRELAFARMVERGLNDARSGRVIADEVMSHRMRTWQS